MREGIGTIGQGGKKPYVDRYVGDRQTEAGG